MRNAIVIGLAILAVLAAGVWGLGEFGGGLTGGVSEPQVRIVLEPECVVWQGSGEPPARIAVIPSTAARTKAGRSPGPASS